jgi:hypothetical protein
MDGEEIQGLERYGRESCQRCCHHGNGFAFQLMLDVDRKYPVAAPGRRKRHARAIGEYQR